MYPRCFFPIALLFLLANLPSLSAQPLSASITPVAPGVWRIRAGTPERFTPTAFREFPPYEAGLKALPKVSHPPFAREAVKVTLAPRGCVVEIPLGAREQIYGFGMQPNSFRQRGMRLEPIVNSWPAGNVGYTHAPAPFYVSTAGYGVFVDTARYPAFYVGSHVRRDSLARTAAKKGAGAPADSLGSDCVVVDIPSARGVDIYLFGGPDLKGAVQRYNLFSGGGCIPPLWGLGVKYRVKNTSTAADALRFARYFRDNRIPVDMLGLEPGWHTHAYSCTYVWNRENFPDPDGFIEAVNGLGYRLNLWEHAYTHSTSPLFGPLTPYSGDFTVWGGLVPDFADPKARSIFADYHEKNMVRAGVSAFKLDECDNANYLEADRAWGFPEASLFPSGLDGEQMHQLYGILYQQTMYSIFRKLNQRTYFDVRASYALAAPYPSALYSDTYGHREYVRQLVNTGFTGHLWSPEVRDCASVEDLVRRLQSAVLAPQTCFNSWYLSNPPWLQTDTEKNNRNEFLPNAKEVEDICRRILEFRMQLVPYLYSAFMRYRFEGIPPVRALVMDYPGDPETWAVDDEYLMGDNLLCAPLFAGQKSREVYLPAGTWYDFATGRKYAGGKRYDYEAALETIPLFVREGSILPLAKPVQHVAPNTMFEITCRAYGADCRPMILFEDDGVSFDFEKGTYSTVEISRSGGKGMVKRKGNYRPKRYEIAGWEDGTKPGR